MVDLSKSIDIFTLLNDKISCQQFFFFFLFNLKLSPPDAHLTVSLVTENIFPCCISLAGRMESPVLPICNQQQTPGFQSSCHLEYPVCFYSNYQMPLPESFLFSECKHNFCVCKMTELCFPFKTFLCLHTYPLVQCKLKITNRHCS